MIGKWGNGEIMQDINVFLADTQTTIIELLLKVTVGNNIMKSKKKKKKICSDK